MSKFDENKKGMMEHVTEDSNMLMVSNNNDQTYAVVYGDEDRIAQGIYNTIMGNQGDQISDSLIDVLKSVVSNLMLNDADMYNEFVDVVQHVTDQIDAMENVQNQHTN